jgi:hypothetical protein
MQKWEYKFVQLGGVTAEEELNKLGEQGWELVAVWSGLHCFLKRPKT